MIVQEKGSEGTRNDINRAKASRRAVGKAVGIGVLIQDNPICAQEHKESQSLR